MAKTIEIRKATQEASAIVLGVAQSTLRSWKDAPRNTDGTYDLPVLNAWYFARKTAEFEGGSDGEKSEALEEYRKWKAKLAKLDFEKACGELWPAAEVKVEVARAFEQAKRTLLQLPAKAAQQVVGAPVEDVGQILDGAVRDCLDELGEALKVEMVGSEQETVKEAV